MPITSLDRLLGLRLLALHQFVYELSGGRIGASLGRAPMLLLRTIGRKTGQPRTAALLYHRDADNYVVVGSKGGSDAAPGWLLNLEAGPLVEVQVGTRRFPAKARVASPAERRRLWPEMTGLWPQYDRYQSQTKRVIPLVIIVPVSHEPRGPANSPEKRAKRAGSANRSQRRS
jgi:deazaflavin-dependent oxidoreductase (nitroreductase family)